MDGESEWQQLQLLWPIRIWRRARFAVWNTAVGIALSSVTVALSALNSISTRQAIAMALPAVLLTIGGIAGWIVPDACVAWRRGFRDGCKATMTGEAYVLRADNARHKRREIRSQK
jgi:hypothetical protein